MATQVQKIEALKLSIKNWKTYSEKKQPPFYSGTDDCACCILASEGKTTADCFNECLIGMSKFPFCKNTPYYEARHAWEYDDPLKMEIEIKREVAFLEDILERYENVTE